MRNIVKKQNGITLIALVVTIIVLIILAGVSINMLVGENGLITQAQSAKEETEIKGDEEKIRLAMSAAQIANNGNTALKADIEIALLENGTKSIVVDKEDGTRNIIFLDSKKIYKLNSDGSIEDTNSDFDSIYVAPDSQDEARNEGVIGIGTDGQPVDMDLWEYTFDSNTGGYALNTIDDLNGTDRKNGYRGNIDQFTGDIEGCIPQYIKNSNTDEIYIPVTNLYDTFRELSELKVISKIPSTIINMSCSFELCNNLNKFPELPLNVKDISWAFHGTAITDIPYLPETIEVMNGAFYGCNSLENIDLKIPNKVLNIDSLFSSCENLKSSTIILSDNVENIGSMFSNCLELENCNITIPQNVKDAHMLFENCYKLQDGKIIIEAVFDSYDHIFFNVAKDSKTLIIYSKDENRDFLQAVINNSRNYHNANIKGSWE